MEINIFEAIMMICFGVSWPMSIAKTIKVKDPKGKSIAFLMLIEIGYISGIIFKIQHFDWGILLYILNGVMVATDLLLVLYYRHLRKSGKLS